MGTLTHLEPSVVWKQFEDICQVPRPSKREDKIIQFMLDFAKKHDLEAKRDEIGNVLITKPATSGYENRKTMVLQSHMDMVCEKNKGVDIDFNNDAITPVVDGDWVKAKGTTLGADDGIGMAVQMALLASDEFEHPKLECLFTVDEETGLTGAFALKSGFFDGKILINLDSEDEGEIFIGCAGGIDTNARFTYKKKPVPKDHVALKLEVEGLHGGHSGDEIHKDLGNANKLLARFMDQAYDDYKIRLTSFDGGNKRNAIPREAMALITVKDRFADKLKKDFSEYADVVQKENGMREPNMKFTISDTETPDFVINKKVHIALIRSVYGCPHGVHTWSPDVEDMVETSTNLASVKFIEDDQIEVVTSQRSSLESGKKDIAGMVASVFKLAKAEIQHSDGYPGWAPNPDSEILRVSEKSYEKLFNKKPVVRAIHAGLECGLFLEKYPYLDMISTGPTIKNAHTPEEKVDIKTVQMWWEHTLDILKNMPEA
ncbi:MAG: aminoacyl-histidine dipeptidase [Bacteroidota bacterium]|nr:aminoacyl-histidine dipeptidase [Bacteroidota bacterium]